MATTSTCASIAGPTSDRAAPTRGKSGRGTPAPRRLARELAGRLLAGRLLAEDLHAGVGQLLDGAHAAHHAPQTLAPLAGVRAVRDGLDARLFGQRLHRNFALVQRKTVDLGG